MSASTVRVLLAIVACLPQLLLAQTWNDAFPDVQGWTKVISGEPSILESRADAPGLLISGAWSNLHGAKVDGDDLTADVTPSAVIDNCNGGDCWDGGTEWLVARGFHFNVPPNAMIKAIAFGFKWNVDGGPLYGCSIELYNFGVLKQNAFVPYAYSWVYQDPYVPPTESQFGEWWPLAESIGWPGDSGVWSTIEDVPIDPEWAGSRWMTTWTPSQINDPGFGAGC